MKNYRVIVSVGVVCVLLILSMTIFVACTTKVSDELPVPCGITYDHVQKAIVWQVPEGFEDGDAFVVKNNGKIVKKTKDTNISVDIFEEDINSISISLLRDKKQSNDSENYRFITKGSNGITYEEKEGVFVAKMFCELNKTIDIVVPSIYDGRLVEKASGTVNGNCILPDSLQIVELGITNENIVDYKLPKDLIAISSIRIDCKEYVISKENPNFATLDGILYSKDMKTLVAYPNLKETKMYYMPDSVEVVKNGISIDGNKLELLKLSKNLNMTEENSLLSILGVEKLVIPKECVNVGLLWTDANYIILEEGMETFVGNIVIDSISYIYTPFGRHIIELPSTIKQIVNSTDAEDGKPYFSTIWSSEYYIILPNTVDTSSWIENWQSGFIVLQAK
ncbi:MAG: hypothetical protein SO434_08180 [Eubacteriales bacterium]|nr:hypothetical protein [Eubacteriales bacterium]